MTEALRVYGTHDAMQFDDIATFALDGPNPPSGASDAAATLLIDTLGVAAGAATLTPARIARNHAVRFIGASRPEDGATLLFDGRRSAIQGAAFAAATQIDNLDAHDGLNPTKGHIGCAVVPALCAFAEQAPDLTLREGLDAMIMAYEVAARAAMALHSTVTDYHTSGAWNALGVAALGSKLRHHKADILRHALGIAEYHGPRSQMMREIAHPTMLHDGSGMGAFVGAMAVFLAEDGFEGAPAITVEREDAMPFWDDLGTRWTVTENYIKPYPICRWAHAALDALHGLMKAHGLRGDDVERVSVRSFAQAAALYPGLPETTSQAQYSLRFALAVLMVHGEIAPRHIDGDGLRDRDVAAQMDKIAIEEAEIYSARFPEGRWADVTLTTQGGHVLHSGETHASGGPEVPIPLGAVEAKFHRMAGNLPEARRAAIWSMREEMQSDRPFSDLLALLHPAP